VSSEQRKAFGNWQGKRNRGRLRNGEDRCVWREHSWGVRREKNGTNTVIETTSPRSMYFGLLFWEPGGEPIAAYEYKWNGLTPPKNALPTLRSIQTNGNGAQGAE
jgi:hypothetical protein